MEMAYALITGQCSDPILERVEAQPGFEITHDNRDPIGLLELIKGVMYNYNSKVYRAVALIKIMKIGIVAQGRHMSTPDYLTMFRNHLDVVKAAGGDMCNHPGMVQD
jgi:hypothetical protein